MPQASEKNGKLVGRKLGKYHILSLIAVGGSAEIYLARVGGEAGFEKYLVVKCLLEHLQDEPEYVKMFLDEARVGAQLEHSNIVQTLELVEDQGHYYLVMEYLSGLSLAQLARRARKVMPTGVLPEHLVLGLAAQACGGLHYAHERIVDGHELNLVHRDVSPQNLIVTFEGVVKIVDFGIAISNIRETRTQGGAIKGKSAYMAPEQCLGEKVDRRTDIFSLGVICHELLTGRRLFKREGQYQTYQAIVNSEVEAPSRKNPAISRSCDEVIMKALSFKPDDRYQTAQEFGEALLAVIHKAGQSVGTSEASAFYDKYLGEELEAHAARMRALVAGTAAAPARWNAEIGDESSGVRSLAQLAADAGGRPAQPLGPEYDDTVAATPALGSVDGSVAAAAVAESAGREAVAAEGMSATPEPINRLAQLAPKEHLQDEGPSFGIVLMVFAMCALIGFGLTVAIARLAG